MKKLISIAFAIAAIASSYADTLKGKVSDGQGNPVEYATVVLLQDSIQKGGTVADSIGYFQLTVPAGKYNLQATSVGYNPTTESITINGTTKHDITLSASSVMMKEVSVTASAIRREADRFVMNVENMPGAIGKDGEELLRDAPGVWINDDKISINGNSGTKVYVNDREMKMSEDQLMTFLRSLKAEEVSKVEVIPLTGSEYSADSSAGVIKITMKKARTDGIMGSVGMYYNVSKNMSNYTPTASLNIKEGKWSFNMNGSANIMPNSDNNMLQVTDYKNGSNYTSNGLTNTDNMVFGYFNGGIFFDLDKNNSFGLEVYFNRWKYNGGTNTNAIFRRPNATDEIMNSIFQSDQLNNNTNATFNYIHRFDSIGTNLKFIASYDKSFSKTSPYNKQSSTLNPVDSISTSLNKSHYDVTNVSLDFTKMINSKWNYSAGAKYTFNKMRSLADYWYMKEQLWKPETSMNYNYNYNENILGLYAKGSFNAKHISVVAGLRGEYTKTKNAAKTINQSYFDLFPNAYITYKIDEYGQNSFTASYSRYISRPSFWSLNPTRTQASDYFYQCGNPDLKPTYRNNISLTSVLKYKYSLTLWMDITENGIMQGTLPDPDNRDNVIFTNVNIEDMKGFGASLNLPFQIKEWWTLNFNGTYIHSQSKTSAEGRTTYGNKWYFSVNTGFQLPLDFYLSLNYFGLTKQEDPGMIVSPWHMLGASIKKSFAKKKWTASFGAHNILGRGFKFTNYASDGSFVSTQKMENPVSFSLSLTYNFNVGEMFSAKKIISNTDESRTAKKDK